MKQETKRRALYFFTCDKCGHKRTSRWYSRAKELICLKCRKNIVPENQLQLFGIPVEVRKDFPENTAVLVNKTIKKVYSVDNKLKTFKGAQKKLEKDIIKIAFGRKKKVCLKE
jgi:hypothetical protein